MGNNMSYIFNNKIEYSDSPNLDAFGRLRVAEITSLLEVKHIYDNLPNQIDQVMAGTATSSFEAQNACVVMGVVTNGDYIIRQSKESAIYQPGKGEIFEASFSDFELDSNVIKRVGYYVSTTGATYDSEFDGFFLESNGITNQVSFQIWKSGTLTYSSNLTNWISIDYNPTNINWSKTNLMIVDFQWLGVGRVRFGLNISGVTYNFVEYSGTNNLTDVYMSSPNKPIRYEMRSSGGTATFHQICSQVSMEGSLNLLNGSTNVSSTNTTTLTSSNVKYPYIGIRASSSHSRISPLISDISILNTSNDNYLVTIEINPTLSSSITFSATTDSAIQYALGTGSQTVTSSGVIIGGFIGAAGTQALTSFSLKDAELKPGMKINGTIDQLWVCITPLGENATFLGSTNVYYYK